MIKDFWGAVSLIFVILMGLFVLSGQYKVNASSALLYCVMAIISGVFDVITCFLYFQHSMYKMYDPKAPWLVLLAQTIFLISPVALFSSAALSYSIFSDCRDNSPDALFPMRGGALDYGSLGPWDGVPQQRGERPTASMVPPSGTRQ